jgi:uncharacterized membrane protein
LVSKRRSLAKSITWRLIAIVVTFLVGFVMTGSLTFAASLSLLSNLINFVLYYLHERVWLKINWGRHV